MVVGRRFQHDGRVVNRPGSWHHSLRMATRESTALGGMAFLARRAANGNDIFLLFFVRQEFDGFGLPFLCLLEVGNCSVVLLSWSRNRDNEGVWLVFAMYQDS